MKGLTILIGTLIAVTSAAQTNKPEKPDPPKIVVIAPQSGSSAYFGKVVVNGILLSVMEAGTNVRYQVLDDRSDPIGVPKLVQQAVASGAVAILGPLDSDVAAAAAKQAEQLKIPLISPCATATYLTRENNQWFFRANTSDRQRADDLASWATEIIGRKGVLVVNETRTSLERTEGRAPLYGEALADDLSTALKSQDQPTSAVTFQRDAFNDATRDAITARIGAGVVGAVAILSRSEEAVPIAELVRRKSPRVPILLISPGRDQFSHSTVRDEVYAVTDTAVEVTRANELDNFRRRYSLAYPDDHTPLQQCATFGYDAANILLSAITRAEEGGTPQKLSDFRMAVRNELTKTPNDRQGVISVGGFTAQHELNFRPHRLVLLKGQWVEPGEAAAVDADIISRREAMYLSVLLLFLASLIALLVWQLPKLHRFADRTVVFVISAVVGLVASLVTFGALHSYGSLTGQYLGVAFEFGGPAALFVSVLILGTRTSKTDRKPFTITAILQEATYDRGVVAVDGSMSLLLPKGQRKEAVKAGQAVFEAIDSEYRNQSVDYVLSVPGYQATVNSSQVRLTPDSVVYVRVRKD